MGGPNLEVFKFGMYILFPIGIMYYFGTNLDNKFTVPDFWPRPEQTNRIPYEREEIAEELERMRRQRLERRQMRVETESKLEALQGRTQSMGDAIPTQLHAEQPQLPQSERKSVWTYLKPNDARSW